MSYNNHSVRVGADIGGTFTDVVLEIGTDQYSAKVLTNYSEPEQAIIDGLVKVVGIAGVGIELQEAQAPVEKHGTTGDKIDGVADGQDAAGYGPHGFELLVCGHAAVVKFRSRRMPRQRWPSAPTCTPW